MVHVTIPNAIQSGRNAILTCDYELEDDDLYSVKWYKGKTFPKKSLNPLFCSGMCLLLYDIEILFITFHYFP